MSAFAKKIPAIGLKARHRNGAPAPHGSAPELQRSRLEAGGGSELPMTGLAFASPAADSADSATELRSGAGPGPPAPYSDRPCPSSSHSGRPRPRLDDLELFAVSPRLPVPRRGGWLAATALLHVVAVAALVLVPLFAPDALSEWGPDPIRVLIYDPPPPPPPPLPLGSTTGGREKVRAPVEPKTLPTPAVLAPSTLTAPVEKMAMRGDSVGLTVEAPGSPHGSESGVPEGMEEGVPGGVVGGIPGGVVGGVIGGTGTGLVPVRDVDRPPRLLQQVRPSYPSEAFVKKVEGTVVIEIVIDERGVVVRTRIVRSVPLLDAAAVAAVRQWIFAPALKQGRAVATLAIAPVTFRIF